MKNKISFLIYMTAIDPDCYSCFDDSDHVTLNEKYFIPRSHRNKHQLKSNNDNDSLEEDPRNNSLKLQRSRSPPSAQYIFFRMSTSLNCR